MFPAAFVVTVPYCGVETENNTLDGEEELEIALKLVVYWFVANVRIGLLAVNPASPVSVTNTDATPLAEPPYEFVIVNGNVSIP